MVREAEVEEMEKKWAAENERIMREHPLSDTPADDATDQPTLADPGARSIVRAEDDGTAEP